MSVYSETQEALNYFRFVQSLDKDAGYEPAAILQGLYNPFYYPIFESMMIQKKDAKSLALFTSETLKKVVPAFAEWFPKELTIGYNGKGDEYDPTIRFYYQEDNLLGFIDLPAFTFYYTEDPEVRKVKKKLNRIKSQIRKLQKEKEESIRNLDYTEKSGAKMAVAFMRRKKNAKKAFKVSDEYDRKIDVEHARMQNVYEELNEKQFESTVRSKLIQEIRNVLSEQLGMESKMVEPKEKKKAGDL